MKTKTQIVKAGALIVTMMFFSSIATTVLAEEGSCEFTIEIDNPTYGDLTIIEDEEYDGGDGEPETWGGKASYLSIKGLYWWGRGRRHAYGCKIIEWTWFNGQTHHSHVEGHVRIKFIDGTPDDYFEFNWNTVWSGLGLVVIGNGFTFEVDPGKKDKVDYIQVHVERVVDDFPPEVKDRTFYGNNRGSGGMGGEITLPQGMSGLSESIMD